MIQISILTTQGIEMYIEGDWVKAKGTTLRSRQWLRSSYDYGNLRK